MSNANAWSEFDTLRHSVKLNTVDRLKQILTGFNDECGTNLTKSGKKQELIDRITREMDNWRATNNIDKWNKGKLIVSQVRNGGVRFERLVVAGTEFICRRRYSPARSNADYSYSSSSSHNAYSSSVSGSHGYQAGASSSSGAIPRYDPYAPPRRPAAPSAPAPAVPQAPSIRFKSSPFFHIERAVSGVVECPESTSSMDRRQQSLVFAMNNDILSKINSTRTSQKFQLRLYCTSSTYYTPSGGFRSTSGLCPIEFPPTCEVRVNGVALTANLKGMKKKPGTAPPPDLGKSLRLTTGASNRIEMVYVNSQQPVQSKKFYLVVMLVEVTTVDQLIDRLKKGKFRSSQDILNKMTQAVSGDDDIVAGHQKMSLKCPLSYMRISTPCRSSHCVHSQCFDALSWFSLMEQTTTWLCPVCEKVLNVEDLIVDGYFTEILQQTSEEVEDVIVEADGQWHTEDNKFGTAAWRAAHPPSKPVIPAQHAPVAKPRTPSPRKPTPYRVNGEGKPRPSNEEIVILDSDDEDEGRVKRELSPSTDSPVRAGASMSQSITSQPSRSRTQDTDVIDLTLDSEDEEAVPLTRKRKTYATDIPSPTEQIWKKSRTDGMSSSPASSSANAGYSGGPRYAASSSRSLTNGHPPVHASPSDPRYPFSSGTQPYPGGYYPPVAPTGRRPSTNSYPRVNGSSPESWRS
ncbi:uncharacterized protein FIBRA_01031 [Fibroporia radiculosa]|uniref:SP-RING-type domain-containing protein n=1 Tax=Fibroporia radiculosa TaxID=599839 RepID=J4HSM9_9APHY|nr:uncharacterized protein FIBRA_01031 [Fibroporia radiculosa]CCL99022.1 predicted protein [Fibroporia radiculosa]